MVTIDGVFTAYYEFRKGKRNKKDVLEFEAGLEENLFDLYQDLVSGNYKHGPYHQFSISDPKPRQISKATVRDRVVHHLVYKKLSEIYEPIFIYDSYSSRCGKGTHKAVERLSEFIRRGDSANRPDDRATQRVAPTIIKCDIKKFFDSVDHEILIQILEEKIKDKRFTGLLKEIICSFSVETNGHSSLQYKKGIPLGNVTSQIFANIYLNELDQFIKHRLKIKHYIRYSDDMIMVMPIHWYGWGCRGLINQTPTNEIECFLQENLKLQLHPYKISIRKLNQGIDFLGYVVFSDHIVLRTKTKRRILRKVGAENFLPLRAQSYFTLLKWCKNYKIRLNICKIICKKWSGINQKNN